MGSGLIYLPHPQNLHNHLGVVYRLRTRAFGSLASSDRAQVALAEDGLAGLHRLVLERVLEASNTFLYRQ